MKTERIKSLGKISQKDLASYGGKAVALGELIRFGINIPSGFVISSEVTKKPLTAEFKTKILKHFEGLKTKNVAVRSSSAVEDSKAASWAGQFDTVLNVDRKGLIKAIEKCLDATGSARVKAYAKENKVPLKNIKLAIIVQKMVPAESAGVAFSAHPVSQEQNQAVIEAVKGLGEALVSGKTTPDRYVIDKKSVKLVNASLVGTKPI